MEWASEFWAFLLLKIGMSGIVIGAIIAVIAAIVIGSIIKEEWEGSSNRNYNSKTQNGLCACGYDMYFANSSSCPKCGTYCRDAKEYAKRREFRVQELH